MKGLHPTDPFDYYRIKRFFVPFGKKLNSFNKLHSLRSCNFVNSFNLFPNYIPSLFNYSRIQRLDRGISDNLCVQYTQFRCISCVWCVCVKCWHENTHRWEGLQVLYYFHSVSFYWHFHNISTFFCRHFFSDICCCCCCCYCCFYFCNWRG